MFLTEIRITNLVSACPVIFVEVSLLPLLCNITNITSFCQIKTSCIAHWLTLARCIHTSPSSDVICSNHYTYLTLILLATLSPRAAFRICYLINIFRCLLAGSNRRHFVAAVRILFVELLVEVSCRECAKSMVF